MYHSRFPNVFVTLHFLSIVVKVIALWPPHVFGLLWWWWGGGMQGHAICDILSLQDILWFVSVEFHRDHEFHNSPKFGVNLSTYSFWYISGIKTAMGFCLCYAMNYIYKYISMTRQHQYVVSLSKTLYLHCFSRLSCEMSTRWGQPREGCSVL